MRHRCAEGFPGILLAQGSGVVDSRSRNIEIGLSVQWFHSAIVVENVARPNVQTIKAKSSQPNKSLNLTSPALRGGQRSGAVKRAPQVSSSPLCCKSRFVGWLEPSKEKCGKTASPRY